jgi:hypothetical protein
MAVHDGNSFAALFEREPPLDASAFHLAPSETVGFSIYERRDGVLFHLLFHGDDATYKALVDYLMRNGATVGGTPAQDKEALAKWERDQKDIVERDGSSRMQSAREDEP